MSNLAAPTLAAPTTPATPATLAILAGGEGARMGKPKAELRIGEKPILNYLFERFAWRGPTLLVTAPGREHPPGAELFTHEAVDLIPGQGPLRGILTALKAITTPTVIITTIDMPAIGPEQLKWLGDRFAAQSDAAGLMIERGPQIEPFPSIYRRHAGKIVRAQLDAGQLSVQKLSKQPGFLLRPAPAQWDESIWTNLNQPADVQAFAQGEMRTTDEHG